MFAKVGGEWVLIGIHSARGGSPYDSIYSVPVGNYDEWIAGYVHVPEPISLVSLAVGGMMLLLGRKVR